MGNAVSTRRLHEGEARDVAELAAGAATALSLTGPVDMDIRRLPSGEPVVLEVNARFGANTAQVP